MRRFITDALVAGIVCGGILASLASRPVAAAGRVRRESPVGHPRGPSTGRSFWRRLKS